MHEVLVNRLGGLSLPRKSVVKLTDRPDMTLDVYRGRKTTIQPTIGNATHCTPMCEGFLHHLFFIYLFIYCVLVGKGPGPRFTTIL